MKKLTITNLEALNILAWNDQLSDEKRNAIPMKVRFYLKKLCTKLLPDAKEFEEFRDSELKKIQDVYAVDEKSYETEEPKVDAHGEVIKDADGNEETQTIRKIKDEYLEDYQKEIGSLNEKLNELLNEKNTYEVNIINVEEMVEKLPDDTPLEFEDINMFDAIFSDNGEA